jgi:flagellar FliL protein
MADAVKTGRRELMTTLVVVLLLTLVGAGVGFAIGTLLGDGTAAVSPEIAKTGETETPASEKAPEAAEGEQQQAEEEKVALDDLKILPFPPVLTTLAEPKGKWIRLEGSILAKPGGEIPPEKLAEQAGEQILTYLRSVRLSQLESASGILGLRDDLDETVRTLSSGDVQGVLIHGLVVE